MTNYLSSPNQIQEIQIELKVESNAIPEHKVGVSHHAETRIRSGSRPKFLSLINAGKRTNLAQ